MLPSMILITSDALGRFLASKQVHAWYRSAMACGHSSGTLHDSKPSQAQSINLCTVHVTTWSILDARLPRQSAGEQLGYEVE